MALQFFDAKPYFDTEPIRDLMWRALPFPNDEMLDRLLQRYHDDDQLRLVAAIDDGETVQGIVGLRLDDEGEAMILHLRSNDDEQHDEIGGALLRTIIKLYHLRRLNGRSSEPHIPFYESLGFSSWVVGEKPPGSKWYGVRWESVKC